MSSGEFIFLKQIGNQMIEDIISYSTEENRNRAVLDLGKNVNIDDYKVFKEGRTVKLKKKVKGTDKLETVKMFYMGLGKLTATYTKGVLILETEEDTTNEVNIVIE